LRARKGRFDFENRSYEIQVDEAQEFGFSENNIVFGIFMIRYEGDCRARAIRKTTQGKKKLLGNLI
jgi:hypothetical protein